MIRMHLTIHGQVQGVGFRISARQRAQSLRLVGWVRNVPNGSVEAEVQGPEDAVFAFTEWASRGPAGSWIERIDSRTEKLDEALQTFRILPS